MDEIEFANKIFENGTDYFRQLVKEKMEINSTLQITKHFQTELNYYRSLVQEQKEIIDQLSSGTKTGDVEFIHPYDFCEIINDLDARSYVYNTDMMVANPPTKFGRPIYTIGVRKFLQTPHIPSKIKGFE